MMKKLFVISLLFIFGFIALAPETYAYHRNRRSAYRSNYYPAYYGTGYRNNCAPVYGARYRSYRSRSYARGYRTYSYPTYVRTYRTYNSPYYYNSGYRTPYYRVAGTRYVNPYRRRSSRTRAALSIGVPAAIGAGVGALLGGGKGAGIGALLGGGGGAAYYFTRRNRRY